MKAMKCSAGDRKISEVAKMKKRYLAAVFALVAAMVFLTACGGGSDSSSDEESAGSLSGSVRVAAYEGSADKVVENLGKDYKVRKYDELLKLEDAVKKGNFDIAVLPTTDADWLYGKTGKDLVILSPCAMNGIYVLSNNYRMNDPKMSSFAGKTIYVTGERSTGARVFQYLMSEAGIGTASYKIKVLDSYGEIKKAVNDYGNFVIAEEPYASQYMKSDSVVKLLDLSKEFRDETDLDIPADCVICSRDFYNKRSDDLKAVLSDYQEATKKAGSRNLRPVFYGASSRGISLVKNFNNKISGTVGGLYGGSGSGGLYYTEK